MKFRMSASSDRQMFLPLAGTPDGQLEISVRSGEAKDLGEVQLKANASNVR